jgi:hypothetical protein
LRVRLDYVNADGSEAGSRFFLSYAGAAPTAGNCITLATDIATAWSSNLGGQVSDDWALQQVDVLDIASVSGASGQWTGHDVGGETGTAVPSQCAVNIEFGIARRYRGGKPRMFLPGPSQGQLLDSAHWTTGYQSACQTAVGAFFTAIEALSVGAVGALGHVNLSYYTGFKNITNSSGRERAVPQYRTAAQLDTVNTYNVKAVVGSQRRRRTATTY